MDFDDLVDYTVLQPHGDRTCECLCGCTNELLPEEEAICSACDAGVHADTAP